jgi:hypothetical protein
MIVVMLAAATARADVPDSAAAMKRRIAELRKQCNRPDATACVELGSLAASEYTVTATGYHHAPDLETARAAHRRAIELLGPACAKGDGKACNQIAQVYGGEALVDRAKALVYLERACAAKDGWSCFDRGQKNGRSKSTTVPWYAQACALGERAGCKDLSMMVLASFVLDPADRPPMDAGALRKILAAAVPAGARPTAAHQQALALAVARTWMGDRKAALAELAEAKAKLPVDEPRLHFFAAYAELVAADGFDRPRAQLAWQRLTELATKRDGAYKDQQLQSDYSFADPTPAMTRARAIADRNR